MSNKSEIKLLKNMADTEILREISIKKVYVWIHELLFLIQAAAVNRPFINSLLLKPSFDPQ